MLESASKAVAHTGTPPEVPVFAQLPTPSENRPARQACVAATVRFGMAEIDIYSGADVAIVETLCRSISHVK